MNSTNLNIYYLQVGGSSQEDIKKILKESPQVWWKQLRFLSSHSCFGTINVVIVYICLYINPGCWWWRGPSWSVYGGGVSWHCHWLKGWFTHSHIFWPCKPSWGSLHDSTECSDMGESDGTFGGPLSNSKRMCLFVVSPSSTQYMWSCNRAYKECNMGLATLLFIFWFSYGQENQIDAQTCAEWVYRATCWSTQLICGPHKWIKPICSKQ